MLTRKLFDKQWIFLSSLFVLTSFLIGLWASPGNQSWYSTLKQPAFMPPNWVFPVVWTLLYLLLATIARLLWELRHESGMKWALVFFVLQMIGNWMWSPVFFVAHQMYIALGLLVVILGLSLMSMLSVIQTRLWLSMLWLPYIAWLGFALYLNAAVILLNA
ncbi:MAG: TspO/MBR family protein [Candidatus Comchoanobacterales bacterium]